MTQPLQKQAGQRTATPTCALETHPHILRHVLSFTDGPTLASALRVSRLFYDEAGAVLYRHIAYNPDRDIDPFFDLSPAQGKKEATLKDRLLDQVRILDIREHHGTCSGLGDVGLKMPRVQTVRFCGPNLRAICDGHTGPCSITANLSPRTLVFIYNPSPLRSPGTDLAPLLHSVTRVVLLVSSTSAWLNYRGHPLHQSLPHTVKEVVVIFDSYRETGPGPGWLGDRDGYTDSSRVRQLAEMVMYDTTKRYDFVNAGWIMHPQMDPRATLSQVQARAELDLREEMKKIGIGIEFAWGLEAVRFLPGEEYVGEGRWRSEFTEKELDNWLWVKL